jgi:hypothetical protein
MQRLLTSFILRNNYTLTVVSHSELVGKVTKFKEVFAGSKVGNRLTDLII